MRYWISSCLAKRWNCRNQVASWDEGWGDLDFHTWKKLMWGWISKAWLRTWCFGFYDISQPVEGTTLVFFILQNHAINLRVFGKSPGPLALGDEDLALFSHPWFQPRYIPPMGGRIERSLGNKTSTSSKLSSLSSSIQRIQSMFSFQI